MTNYIAEPQIKRARQLLTEIELELQEDKPDREFVESRSNSIMHIMVHLKGKLSG